MPQTYNPFLVTSQDDSPMGRSSRYMKALNCALTTRRRAHTVHEVEKRRLAAELGTISGHVNAAESRYKRTQEKILERLSLNQAEQKAYNVHNLKKGDNYANLMKEIHPRRDLIWKQSLKQIIFEDDPSQKRAKKISQFIDTARSKTNSVIERNLRMIESPNTRDRKEREILKARELEKLEAEDSDLSESGGKKKVGPKDAFGLYHKDTGKKAVLRSRHGFVTKPYYKPSVPPDLTQE